MKHADVIAKLSLREKCALLSGETVFTTRGYKNAGIPAITLSDGPNGVRKQAGSKFSLEIMSACFKGFTRSLSEIKSSLSRSWRPCGA